MLRIAHLIDDTQPGGVMRYLDFLATSSEFTGLADHQVIPVSRIRPAAKPIEADLIVSHLTITWRGLPGLMLLRASYPGTPLYHVEHSYCGGFAAANVTAHGRFRSLLRSGYSLFDRVVAVSTAQADWMRRLDLIAAQRLTVIPPCVDLGAFRQISAPIGPVRRIGAIGRFDRQKGFDILIQAFRSVPGEDLELLIFGDGPEAERLHELGAADHRVRFPGFAANPADAIAQCDAVVMPSRWEPFGLVALEARSAQRPLMVTAVDGLRDHVAMGAIPVRGRAVENWTEALSNLVEHQNALPLTGEAAASIVEPEMRTRRGWCDLLSG